MIEAVSVSERRAQVQGEAKSYMNTLRIKTGMISVQTGLSARIVSDPLGEPCPDLSLVWRGMQDDKFVLKPPMDELVRSYEEGQATVLVAPVDGREVAVGYIRRSNLLNSIRKLQLGLLAKIPDVQEIGSSFMLKEFRKTGVVNGQEISYYELMRRMEMAKALPDIVDGKLLVIGTSKNKSIDDINKRMNEDPFFEQFGVGLFNTMHTSETTDLIAPFTCVCKPDFGSGFQLTKHCENRVVSDQLGNLEQHVKRTPNGREIPCIMYVSSYKTAASVNEQLRNSYTEEHVNGVVYQIDPQDSLVSRLKDLGYYNDQQAEAR